MLASVVSIPEKEGSVLHEIMFFKRLKGEKLKVPNVWLIKM